MKTKVKNYWPTYALLGVITLIFGGLSVYIFTNIGQDGELDITTSTSTDQVASTPGASVDPNAPVSPESIYPNTKPMQIGSTTVMASVAESWTERIRGLSDTPYLPEDIVKLFIFDSSGYHSIWMKDMNYAIDIIWVSEEGVVVHMAEGAAPESFPAMFVPEVPAKYVIETAEGFVAKNGLELGAVVVLPNL
ncbi:MAG: hypothetical protein UW75_C0006G0008 [Parcubacteria group bacterium GW2011_GWF2_44_8]|nr:MAG: hypothetical protein UW75_C0006G0008 [Parcubacteria group bacterium GW2011_GWF2_44_8]